ncbi:hypothetical protein NQL31_001477 [Lotmaria passim]
MSSIFDVAPSVLEMLRVDIHEWRRSPDELDRVQRGAARKEDLVRRDTLSSHPAPPFYFQPLATAPATGVVFSSSQCERRGGMQREGCTQASDPSISQASGAAIKTAEVGTPPHSLPTETVRQAKAAQGTTTADDGTATARHAAPPPPRRTPVSTSAIAGPSRWASRLRLLSPAAQELYAELAAHGRVVVESTEVHASHVWRRRVECPRDAELRRAVRDFLYRMNILSCLDLTAADKEHDRSAEVDFFSSPPPPALADAVLNGTALCQLVSSLLREGEATRQRSDAVPCRCPRTLEEVRVNYAQALSALRGAPAMAREHIRRVAWQVLPEDVLCRSSPTALLTLFVHLISTFLPAPEELPMWKPEMCWQPSADVAANSAVSSTELATAEADCCAFLHACGVLPDPSVYNLPGPECLIPSPLAAPFMASWTSYVARTDAAPPPSLLLPSIWPYLCNGVLLVLLARRCGAAAAARAAQSNAAAGPFFANPRTVSCCVANIQSAFRSFQAVSALPSSLRFFAAESASRVLRGDRVHVVSLVLHMRDVLRGRRSTARGRTAIAAATAAAQNDGAAVDRTPLTGNATPLLEQTPGAVNLSSPLVVTPPSALKRQTPATIAKTVARRYSVAADTATAASPSRSASAPLVHFDPAINQERQRTIRAPSLSSVRETQNGVPSSGHGKDGEPLLLLQWLCRLLGPDFRYTAVDQSCSFDVHHPTLSQPCFFFSDGVLLAHVIGLLECRRCDFLDCVQPATKKAARLFNVRRCLEFLRSSAGVAWDLPLLDEAIVNGSVQGVVAVLRALRGHYGLTHRSSAIRGEEKGSVTASVA